MNTFIFGTSLLLVAISFANGKPFGDVGFGFELPASIDETVPKELDPEMKAIFPSSTPESLDFEMRFSSSGAMVIILRDEKTEKLTEEDLNELLKQFEKGVSVDVSKKVPSGWEEYTKPISGDSPLSDAPEGVTVHNYVKQSATGPILVIVGTQEAIIAPEK